MLKDNLAYITQRMAQAARRAGRRSEDVKLVAVSKGQPASALAELAQAGQTLFGESYLQEAEAKINRLAGLPHITWHFIGPLQSNKASRVVSHFSCVQSLHKKELAKRLNRLAGEQGKILQVLIQVDMADESTKSGCTPQETGPLAQYVAANLPNLQLKGLMTLPPYDDDQEQTRPWFARLRELAEKLARDLPPDSMRELSMGMSGDFAAAIEEGATLVRVGTALFGPRRAE